MQRKKEENPFVDNEKAENDAELADNKKKSAVHHEGLPDADEAEQDDITRLELQLSESKDKYLRIYSEFENYKKRIHRERLDLVKSAGADILLSLLPVVDDFERAIKAGGLPEGIDLIYNKLVNFLSQKGVKPMESIGKPFDPDLHDAISNMPAPSDNLKGKVVDEIEKGYYLNDKVIRHAKVIVGA